MTPIRQPLPTPPDARRRPDLPDHGDIRVLIVDDHPAVRLGTQALIDDQPDMRVVAGARSIAEALGATGTPIDVAVVDYHLREGRDGLALIEPLGRLRPAPRVLVYSAFADAGLAMRALIAGADGLLGKHELGEELCDVIRRLARGRRHFPAIEPPVARAVSARLEPGDRAIFGMLLHGDSPAEIATRRGITPGQLATRRTAMLRSLRSMRREPAVPTGGAAPLDYERPKRRRRFARC